MHILWIATKPPWPTVDGGRLLLFNSLRALAGAGHRVTLVAPWDHPGDHALGGALEAVCEPVLVRVRRPPRWLTAIRAVAREEPWTMTRHQLAPVQDRVRELLAGTVFDGIFAEQVQALGALSGSFGSLPPLVWRAQNVESDLWAATADEMPLPVRIWLRREARCLAAVEARAVGEASASLALTREDQHRLEALSGSPVLHLPAPFEESLPSGASPLAGSPPVVLFGSAGWRPNRSGASWFLRQAWPRVRTQVPGARLHVFGSEGLHAEGIAGHPAPEDSRQAFPSGSVLVVPLSVASGVRMKILEAWARGVAVVATPAAVRGLGASDGQELLVARSGEEFAAAIARLRAEPGLAAGLVEAGRELLRREHGFASFAGRLEEIYSAIASARSSGTSEASM